MNVHQVQLEYASTYHRDPEHQQQQWEKYYLPSVPQQHEKYIQDKLPR
jgi:hypothetical protein